MKLKFALFLSVCALSTGFCVNNAGAAKISSGESGLSTEKLTRQLTLQNEKVRTLEAENLKLLETVDALKLLAYAPNARKAQMSHTIKVGETVTQIANRNGISREMLMKVNHISENQQIYIGDVLIIPPAPPTEEGEVLVVKADVPKATQTPKPSKSKTKTTPAPKPAPKKTSAIAWTQTEKTKTEKAAPAPPVKTVATKVEPKKVEVPKVKPVTVAKAEPKPKAEKPKATPATVAKAEPKPKAEVAKPSPPKKENPKPEATKTELAKTAEKPKDSGFTYYTIKFGDNLGKIARKHGISVGALMNFNNIKNPNKISGGQKLKIPSKEAAKSLSKFKTTPAPVVIASSGNNKPQPGDAYGIYVVQSGDNLYDLARDFFTTEKKIQELNKMGDKSAIAPGQDLIVPTAEYVKKSALANN